MRKRIFYLLILLISMSCNSIKRHNEAVTKLHSVTALHSDVDKLYVQLQKHHPNLYQYTAKADLEFKLDSLKESITTPLTSRDFYKQRIPVIKHVRQGHLSIRPLGVKLNKKEQKARAKTKFDFYALDFEYLDERLLVKRTVGKDSTLVGAEVLKVEGEPVNTLVDRFKTRFTSDGYNKTLYNRAIGRSFKRLYIRDKGRLDSLNVTFKLRDSVFDKVFEREAKALKKTKKNDSVVKKDTVAVKKKTTPETLSAAQKRIRRAEQKQKRSLKRKRGYIARSKEYTRNFDYIGKDSAVAYMKIRSFTNGKYKKFYKESFQKLRAAQTKHLILDLRDNGGGRIAEVRHLYSYLTPKAFQFTEKSKVTNRIPVLKALMSNTTPLLVKGAVGVLSPLLAVHNLIKVKKRDSTLYYNLTDAKLKKPNAINYTGALYVLINGNSFSASSLISTHLKATKRATFIGEETGGAYNGCVAGYYKIYQLPETKLLARIGILQIEAPYKQTPDGYGILPDVAIAPTFKDRQEGRDPELEWVLNEIEKNNN